jgi:hypothetical protein
MKGDRSMRVIKKRKGKTSRREDKIKARGCFGNQKVKNEDGIYKERKHPACDWRNSKKGFIKTKCTWSPEKTQSK